MSDGMGSEMFAWTVSGVTLPPIAEMTNGTVTTSKTFNWTVNARRLPSLWLSLVSFVVAAASSTRAHASGPPMPTALAADPALAAWLTKNGRASAMTFSRDGKRLVVGTDRGGVALWDLARNSAVQVFRASGRRVTSVDLSPDGARTASVEEDGRVRIWTVASGKQLRTWSSGRVKDPLVRFAPDGRQVATAGLGMEPILWEVGTGKLLRRPLSDEPGAEREPQAKATGQKAPGVDGNVEIVDGGDVGCLLFSSSDRLLMGGEWPLMQRGSRSECGPDGSVCCWHLDGKEDPAFRVWQIGRVFAVAESWDCRLLAAGYGGENAKLREIAIYLRGKLSVRYVFFRIVVRDLVRSEDVLNRTDLPGSVTAVSFPLGGTALAFVAGTELRVRDLKTGTDLCRRRLGREVRSPTFSLDGGKLAFIGADGAIAFHDLASEGARASGPLNLSRLWTDLAAEDARLAYRAACSLAVAPGEVVRLLAKQLRPVPRRLSLQIPRLVADLDHDEFKRRMAAESELTRLGPLAERQLRSALARPVSLEQEMRVEHLLHALPGALDQAAADLRNLRAIWVLHRAGTPAAIAILKDLARGAPEARQTQAARTALHLLDQGSR